MIIDFLKLYLTLDECQMIEVVDVSKGHPPIYDGRAEDAPIKFFHRQVVYIKPQDDEVLYIALRGEEDGERLDTITQKDTGDETLEA